MAALMWQLEHNSNSRGENDAVGDVTKEKQKEKVNMRTYTRELFQTLHCILTLIITTTTTT